MATLRDIKRKIAAVRKTRQITRAMNMVAAAKLRKVQGRMEGFGPYARKFAEVMANLSQRVEADIHPLLVPRESVTNVELMVFTADRGLCGSFNNNLITRAEKWIKELERKGIKISLVCIGKKARDYFVKRGYNVRESHVYVYGKVDISFINDLSRKMINRYLQGETDEVHMLFMEFVSMARQVPKFVKLIPIERQREDEVITAARTEYLFEPSPEELV
ncbi:MAG: F0F1 ATP synthase subunit gamma, partial [Desulfatiglandales bacterium]